MARIVTGLTRSISLAKLYNECGRTNLLVRSNQQNWHFMHKVNNGMVPAYIVDLILPLVRENSGYTLRKNNIFLHYSLEQMFHQDQVYHQLLECGTTLIIFQA